MSTTPTLVQSTGSPVKVRPAPRPQQRQNRNSSPLMNSPQNSKQHNVKGKKFHQHNPLPHGSNNESNLTKSLKALPQHQLQHSNSAPSIPQIAKTATPPTTPYADKIQDQKSYASDSNISSGEKATKKKRSQRRNKEFTTSPLRSPPTTTNHQTSPPASSDESLQPTGTPVKAYAGPTFHHSPAPSALPLPSFFSKSVPVASSGLSLSQMMAEDSSENDSPPQPVQESPLAKLFRADSEEKANKARLAKERSSQMPTQSTQANTGRSVSPNYMTSALRSPFNERPITPPSEPRSNGVDLFFSMDNMDNRLNNRPSPVSSPSEFHSRYRANTASNDPAQIEAARKRRDRAMALKEALLKQSSEDGGVQWQSPTYGSSSPTPASRSGLIHSPLAERFPSPMSPTRNQRPQQKSGHTKPNPQNVTFSQQTEKPITATQQDFAQNWHNKGDQLSNAILQRGSSAKDPKAIEDYLRWALKIDAPVL